MTICDEEECKAMYSELATCGETLAVCMDNECLEDADCEEDEVCSTTLALSYEPYYCTETCETDEDCQDNLVYSSCVNFLEISGEDVSICYVDSSTGSTSNFTFDSTLNGGIDMDNSEQPEGNAAEMKHVAVATVSACVFVIALL